MDFIYRGVAFNAEVSGAPALATVETGTFLGKRYQLKRSPISQRATSAQMTYRGVRYTR